MVSMRVSVNSWLSDVVRTFSGTMQIVCDSDSEWLEMRMKRALFGSGIDAVRQEFYEYRTGHKCKFSVSSLRHEMLNLLGMRRRSGRVPTMEMHELIRLQNMTDNL